MCHLKNVIKLVLNLNSQELYSSKSVYKTTMLLKWYHLTLISYRINFLDGRINRFNMIKLVRISFSTHALQFVKQTFSKIIKFKGLFELIFFGRSLQFSSSLLLYQRNQLRFNTNRLRQSLTLPSQTQIRPHQFRISFYRIMKHSHPMIKYICLL